jgi:hypothetical protein
VPSPYFSPPWLGESLSPLIIYDAKNMLVLRSEGKLACLSNSYIHFSQNCWLGSVFLIRQRNACINDANSCGTGNRRVLCRWLVKNTCMCGSFNDVCIFIVTPCGTGYRRVLSRWRATSLHNYAIVMGSTAWTLSCRQLRIVTVLSSRVWSGGVTGWF